MDYTKVAESTGPLLTRGITETGDGFTYLDRRWSQPSTLVTHEKGI